jgi:hypothetical protein
MLDVTIQKDSKIVQILAAQARKEQIDTGDVKNLDDAVMALASDANPHNLYLIGQLVGFTVTELMKPTVDFLSKLADTKRINYGDRVTFNTKLPGIRAFIQAKGATPRSSKIAHKQVSFETIAVSARPQLNLMEMLTGRVQMSELVLDATREMNNVMLGHIQTVLQTGVATWSTPFYGDGSGVVKATIDPMIDYWTRYGTGVTILGDIEAISKFAPLTGFTAATSTQQFAPSIIEELNNVGYIGKYRGANLVVMANPYKEDNITTTLSKGYIYILPTAADLNMRPLKVLVEGNVQAEEARNIDDKTYEIRLDQFFGAVMAMGTTPMMACYKDTTL